MFKAEAIKMTVADVTDNDFCLVPAWVISVTFGDKTLYLKRYFDQAEYLKMMTTLFNIRAAKSINMNYWETEKPQGLDGWESGC